MMETNRAVPKADSPMISSDVLDVGCGPHCLPGAIGIDVRLLPGVAFAHDLNQAPWPLPENHFKMVRIQHVIEHIQNLPVFIRELHRVCGNGAVLEFTTPHYSSYASWGDPTHCHHFALASIPMVFDQNVEQGTYKVLSNEIKFTGAIFEWPGRLIYALSKKRYEKYFAWIWPANEIKTTIQIVKS